VSLKTFIDNITTQVIERHIVYSLEDVFSLCLVISLDEQELSDLAGEPLTSPIEGASTLQSFTATIKELLLLQKIPNITLEQNILEYNTIGYEKRYRIRRSSWSTLKRKKQVADGETKCLTTRFLI